MTYNVFGGMLNLTQSITHDRQLCTCLPILRKILRAQNRTILTTLVLWYLYTVTPKNTVYSLANHTHHVMHYTDLYHFLSRYCTAY